jgi:hypothetical protein
MGVLSARHGEVFGSELNGLRLDFEAQVTRDFDRFNLKFIKEKEMPEIRKWIIALAVVALFAGLASAQVGGTPGTGGTPAGTTFTCGTTNGSVTPTLRAEGYTELTGDIVIVCSGGGTPPALGSVIPTANFTIFMNTIVTSRLLQTGTTGVASEALLLVDEPGSSLAGYGPMVPQGVCTLAGGASGAAVGAGPGGCVEWIGQTAINGGTVGVPVSSNPNTGAGGTYVAQNLPPGANIFQGVVSGAAVTFFGVPVTPPTTIGYTRVYRITNIRSNVTTVPAVGLVPGTVTANISISSSTSIALTNSMLTVGFVQQGLSSTNTLVKNSSNTGTLSGTSGITLNQCGSASITSTSSGAAIAILQYQDNFATAFKTRYTNGTIQNIPGTIYNSESGFFLNQANTSFGGTNGATYITGQADYGTRLKATFTNVPSGVSLYVSTRDVVNSFATPTGTGNALLVVGEGAVDSPNEPGPNTVPAATQTGVYTSPNASTVGYAPVVIGSSNSGSAVWEIVSATPSQIQTLLFSVFINYTGSPATNSPSGSISVTMSFAPTPNGLQPPVPPGATLFTPAQGGAASGTLTIPRFSDALSIVKPLTTFAVCQTALLYPYVINVNGFDTGLAIANTTTDPFGTTAQAGTCSLNFYGTNQPAAPITLGAAGATGTTAPAIATGTVTATLASTLVPGFNGYMIAVCNFQYAHGFAFVSDVGARNLAMGYLALVVNNGTITARGPSGENLNN